MYIRILHLMFVPCPGYRSSMPAESAGQMLQYTKMEALGEIVRRRINVGKYFLSQELVTDWQLKPGYFPVALVNASC